MKTKKWRHMFYQVKQGESIAKVLSDTGLAGWEPWYIAELDLPSGRERTIYFKASFEE